MEKINMTTKKVYILSLGIILMASFYPIYMGAVVLCGYIQYGGIDATDYPKYIIPYTPICIALIVCTVLLPPVFKKYKKFALSVFSILGVGLFLLFEILFEKITVFSVKEGIADVGSWQTQLCAVTPEVMKTIEYQETIGQALAERYSPVFKVHFYLIALLIVLTVIGIIYGFYKMAHTQNFTRKRPLIAQLISVIIFIGLCIFACFTAFFRTGDINISPLSAVLMTIFFLVFGITAGVYTGTCFYEKQKLFSIIIPSLVAMVITFIMYIGEMVMMNWTLFRLGNGFLFERIGIIPFALIDIMTILMSGVITFFILMKIKQKNNGVY
jgi:hypothetical protein